MKFKLYHKGIKFIVRNIFLITKCGSKLSNFCIVSIMYSGQYHNLSKYSKFNANLTEND